MRAAWRLVNALGLAFSTKQIGQRWFDAIADTEQEAAEVEWAVNSARLERETLGKLGAMKGRR